MFCSVKSPRFDLTRRLNFLAVDQSDLPQLGQWILALCSSKSWLISASDIFSSAKTFNLSNSLSTRMRVLQFLHSAIGSEKPPTWPEASQTRGHLNIAESRPT